MRNLLLAATCACLATAAPARAQFAEKVDPKGPQLGEELVQQYRVGVEISARGGPCTGLVATIPVPIEWPEQRVRIINEEKSQFAGNVRYRELDGGVKQMLVTVPRLPAGAEAKVLVTIEVTRHAILAPDDTSIFSIPEKLPREIRKYLGPSPYIESNNSRIRSLAREIVEDVDGGWQQVEAIYDWVRDNVEYTNGPLKGALQALRDGNGDCEELSSLFIALCRANKIPARTVWVPGHCYPEFYLVDDEGKGHWIPCQAAGSRAFGGIPEHRPILQKGDNFRVPERPRDRQRYVAEFLTGKGGQPQVRFIREIVEVE